MRKRTDINEVAKLTGVLMSQSRIESKAIKTLQDEEIPFFIFGSTALIQITQSLNLVTGFDFEIEEFSKTDERIYDQ